MNDNTEMTLEADPKIAEQALEKLTAEPRTMEFSEDVREAAKQKLAARNPIDRLAEAIEANTSVLVEVRELLKTVRDDLQARN